MGHLRGQRNRKSDRYTQERRSAEQSGMVGADAKLCCFCNDFACSDEAGYTRPDELFCRKCGIQRGLIEPIRITAMNETIAVGLSDFMVFSDHRGGPGGTARGTIQAGMRLPKLRTYTCSSSARTAADIYRRAILWASRDKTLSPDEVAFQASAVMEMPEDEARAVVRELRAEIYRQKHPRRQHEVPRKLTNAQVEAIRNRYVTGTESFKRLGREFGVSYGTISQVVYGDTYRSAGGPIAKPRVGSSSWGQTIYRCMEWLRSSDRVAGKRLVRAVAS